MENYKTEDAFLMKEESREDVTKNLPTNITLTNI